LYHLILEDNIDKALIARKEGGVFELLRKTASANGKGASGRSHGIVYDLESYLSNKIASRSCGENDLLLVREVANYALLLTDFNRLPDAVSWYETADNILKKLPASNEGGDLVAIRSQIYAGLAVCYERLKDNRRAAAYRRKAERLACISTAN
jgi:hypothetical protein